MVTLVMEGSSGEEDALPGKLVMLCLQCRSVNPGCDPNCNSIRLSPSQIACPLAPRRRTLVHSNAFSFSCEYLRFTGGGRRSRSSCRRILLRLPLAHLADLRPHPHRSAQPRPACPYLRRWSQSRMDAATPRHSRRAQRPRHIFMVGKFAKAERELARRVADAGHLIGNHLEPPRPEPRAIRQRS